MPESLGIRRVRKYVPARQVTESQFFCDNEIVESALRVVCGWNGRRERTKSQVVKVLERRALCIGESLGTA